MLVIEQPDGTMALIPEWMTEQPAAAVEIREVPRFPVADLRALCQVADTALSLLPDRGNGGRHGTLGSRRPSGAVPDCGANDVTTAATDAAAPAAARGSARSRPCARKHGAASCISPSRSATARPDTIASRSIRTSGSARRIALVFRKSNEFHSIRQVHLWLRQEQIRLRPSSTRRWGGASCGNCRSTTRFGIC